MTTERAEDLVTYCGLFCGDCAGYSGEVADAAASLLEVVRRYQFGRTARALFGTQLAGYPQLEPMLEFMQELRCPSVCRSREIPCEIGACCRERGFDGCFGCDGFEDCTKLEPLEELHGDSCKVNLRAIREVGPAAWASSTARRWFTTNGNSGV